MFDKARSRLRLPWRAKMSVFPLRNGLTKSNPAPGKPLPPAPASEIAARPIFISYSSKDETVAETICSTLEDRQLKCWIAVRDIYPGDNYQEAIVKAIRGAKLLVLILTKNSNSSNEIKNELALASQHRVEVVPVRVEDIQLSDALTYALATRQWINLVRDWEGGIARLASRAAAIVSNQKNPQEAVSIRHDPQAAIAEPLDDETREHHFSKSTIVAFIFVYLLCGSISGVAQKYLLPRLGYKINDSSLGSFLLTIGIVVLIFGAVRWLLQVASRLLSRSSNSPSKGDLRWPSFPTKKLLSYGVLYAAILWLIPIVVSVLPSLGITQLDDNKIAPVLTPLLVALGLAILSEWAIKRFRIRLPG
jgi:hypothetical protein